MVFKPPLGKLGVLISMICCYFEFVMSENKNITSQFMQKSKNELPEKVNKFNKKYSIGQVVHLEIEKGQIIEARIKFKAVMVDDFYAVAWFYDLKGCYALELVKEFKNV